MFIKCKAISTNITKTSLHDFDVNIGYTNNCTVFIANKDVIL